MLETSGRINVIPTPRERPVTAGQLGVDEPDPGWPVIVVSGGRVLSRNLRFIGRDENWLMKKLRENGLRSPGEAYLMTADSRDGVFIAPMER